MLQIDDRQFAIVRGRLLATARRCGDDGAAVPDIVSGAMAAAVGLAIGALGEEGTCRYLRDIAKKVSLMTAASGSA